MSVTSGSASERELRFQAVAAEYLEAREAGRPDELSALLARHPDLADEIAAFVAEQDEVACLAAPLRQAVAPAGEVLPLALPGDHGRLGDFRIVREVGRGGMGVVYEAEQVSLGRRVALKVLPFAATMDPRQLQRFHNEARAAAGLHHTNIVPVFGVGCERGVHYYAMQFIDGRTLADFIAQQRGGPPSQVPTAPEAEGVASAPTVPQAAQATSAAPRDRAYFRRVAEWGIQAAEALDCAHSLGVVHRDVKPANLLVDGTGRLWVTDFGLAQVQSDARLTMTGDLVGTLRYMSPEQALAKRVVIDHRTDVYSLGATLYELLTLEPPFRGTDRQELLRQIAFEEPRPPRRVNKAIPAELETIVLKALEKSPQERYATAQELANDLKRYLRDEPIRARRPSLARRARKWARRHRPAVWAAAVCLLVALVALVGSVGWVLGERAARQREAEGKVIEALEAAAPGLRDGNPLDPALLAAVPRVEARLDGGLLGRELQGRGEQLRRDVDMLRRLEKARLQSAAGVKETGFDFAGANRLYAEAFEWYGLDVTAVSPQEAAERVRASAIGTHLTAALDDWAFNSDRLAEGSGGPLRSVADLSDDDPWRRRLRRLARREDRAPLEGLADEEGALNQPLANLVLLANALFRVRSWTAAERLLRQVHAGHPADFWVNFTLANTLRAKKPPDPAEATRFYQAALALRPLSSVAYHNLGTALADQGKWVEAEATFRQAITLQPDLAEAHHNLGRTLHERRRLDEAVAEQREAIRLKEKFVQAHVELGRALADKGRLDEAIAEYREAIRINKDDFDAHNNLGATLDATGQLDEAIAQFGEALRINKDHPRPHHNLGIVLSRKGRLEEARAEYEQAVRLDPGLMEAHNNLASLLITIPNANLRNPKRAVDLAKRAVQLAPKQGICWNTLGAAQYRAGNWKAAIDALNRSVELSGGEAADFLFLAMSHAQQGNGKDARQWYDRAVEWMDKNKPGDEDRRLRAEAAALMKIEDKPKVKPDQSNLKHGGR
jgi:serine/threonine protein kinase/Flp pilus assembly protein TadD